MAVTDIDNLMDWDGAADEIEAALKRYYPQIMQMAYSDSEDLLGMGVSFDLSNPRIKDVIDTLATRIRNVADTTREDVRRWVEQGTEDGLSLQKIAEQIRSNANGISRSRALTIARTETRDAYNGGALLSYEDAGVSKVELLDSDNDPECAERNGKVVTLDEARDITPHPNCVLALIPVVDREG